MRRAKITASYIQHQRMDNYIVHFESRKQVQAMPTEIHEQYARVSRHLPAPVLNSYGCDSYEDGQIKQICELANAEGIKADLLNPWYLSNEGWQDFQDQWEALPEPDKDLLQQLEQKQSRNIQTLLFDEKLSTDTIHNAGTTAYSIHRPRTKKKIAKGYPQS